MHEGKVSLTVRRSTFDLSESASRRGWLRVRRNALTSREVPCPRRGGRRRADGEGRALKALSLI